MSRLLTLGYSPCPNDTFIFHALIHGLIPTGDLRFRERLEDVETLNQLALEGILDLTKVSYHAFGHLREDYALLRSGGALGRGCGPLVVTTGTTCMNELKGKKIAIPGRLTTANLLLQLYGEGFEDVLILPFDQIMAAIRSGQVEAGVIIHESRFTYLAHGLTQAVDLGVWWEEETGLPIPLGGILARRSLGADIIARVETALRESVAYAQSHPESSRAYIRQHSQELADEVIANHIALYVNPFSLDLGEEGVRAVETLLQRAEERGIIPACQQPLFLT
ncbi:1,4-dihydroxy-6-naphthoate synthase [Desulfuromonas sp. AOP6]|uniref:menaquinone biosynthesis family protein n=1 Tax=Desulfuromonas sp. AOP6 TaxID=1566351 RepID=UPI001287F37E|nr:1,4-dihydroxy-6-naphthoate synthase [Desulfuromonas sp. AOP6]BCA81126.1 1,4-dihydroxy-6-naphtoate synthase [Desulfuromonas sp. AOP6]